MTNYVRALTGLVESARVSYTGVNPDYADIEWQDDRPQPTREECEAAWPGINYQDEYARVERARRERYQQETDGLFFDAQRDGTDLSAWATAVDQIKADLPHPTLEGAAHG